MQPYQPRNMLVTGGAGFIGANFIRHVLEHEPNINIINLDALTYAGTLANLQFLSHPERYHFCQGDIGDEKLVPHLLQHHHIDTIVHFAAESHVDRSIASPKAFIHTNVLGTYNLLEAARQHWFMIEGRTINECRFHHISIDEVYGSLTNEDQAFTEKTAYQPRSPYSASKAASDHFVHAYYHTYGLPMTLSHCSNNYGPYQHAEKFIPTIIRACLQKQKIPVYGNGKNIRDWLYVTDHCRGILAILKRGKLGEHYNMGADNEWENKNLALYICQEIAKIYPGFNYEKLIQYVTDRPGHDFRYAINSNKIKEQLQWQPLESMESGLQKTINFYENKKINLSS